jgi:isopentenyl-diphosphate Delta-isomerase
MKKNIIVVDDNDLIINYKPREIVDKENLRYRVSALWIENSKGEILLAKRAYTKTHNPGKWGPAVSGTVEKGESYENNIIKECEEELGLKDIKLKVEKKFKREGKYNYFGQWFSTIIDKALEDFKIQTEEVEEIKWFSKKELEKQIKNNSEDFINSFKEMWKYFSEK